MRQSRRFVVSCAAVGMALAGSDALSQAYPTKSIRFIAPFPAGGSSDLVARVVAQRLSETLGQSVVIDNRPGVGGSLGAELAARAPADGYTLFLGGIAPNAINVHLYKRIGYDPVRDFIAVATVANAPQMLVAHPSVAARNLAEFVALAKQKPDTVACGSGGIGTPAHFCCEMMKIYGGVRLLHVPYKGTGQSINDLLGGQIQSVFASMPVGISHVRTGKLRALAMTGAKRSPQAPELPTMVESGIARFVSESWWGVMVPAKTPAPVVERLATEVSRIVAEPEVRERFAALGIDPWQLSREEFARFMPAEVDKLGRVVREAGIKGE